MSNPAAQHLPWIVSEAARSHGVLLPGRPRNVISPGGVFPDAVTDRLSLFEPVGVVSCKQQLPITSPSTAVNTRFLDPGIFGLDDRSSRKQPTARGSPAGSSSRPAKGDPCDPGNSTRAGARPTPYLWRTLLSWSVLEDSHRDVPKDRTVDVVAHQGEQGGDVDREERHPEHHRPLAGTVGGRHHRAAGVNWNIFHADKTATGG